MASRVPITIRVDRFEGPLDLLLYLIQSHELDVSKISIAKITDQYLAYVRLMQELNFDIASDFLLMAATLIQWKSKSLLPVEVDPNAVLVDGDDALSPEDLLRQLQEHQRFLEAGRDLGALTMLGDDVFNRPNHRKPTEKVWKLMDVTGLALTYQDLLVKERKRTTILKKETVSLAEKILDFGNRMEVGKLTGLRSLLRDAKSNPETVVTFLATLELSRLRKMNVFQEKVYDEIYVELLESIKGFDTTLASGFDAIESTIERSVEKANVAARDDQREADRVAAADADRVAAAGDATVSSGDDSSGHETSDSSGLETGTSGSDAGVRGKFHADDSAAIGSFLEDASATGDFAELLLAAHSGIENRTGPGSALETLVSDFGGTQDGFTARDSDGLGLAGSGGDELAGRDGSGAEYAGAAGRGLDDDRYNEHGIDLHSFGEDRGPHLREVLAGTDDGSESPQSERDELTDGRGHGALARNADDAGNSDDTDDARNDS